jgi:hypothetical protein
MKLWSWWEETFTEEQRRRIEGLYDASVSEPNTLHPGEAGGLTRGRVWSSQSRADLVAELGSLCFEHDENLSWKLWNAAEDMARADQNWHAVHFMFQDIGQRYYKLRDSRPDALEKAVAAAKKQIEVSVPSGRLFKNEWDERPSHWGFTQLAIIFDKQGRWKEAISVCKQARKQRWAGDWDRRIERYEKRIEKAKS